MITTNKDTGVSQVVGSILLISLITVSVGLYTTQVVPLQVQEQEINHYDDRVQEMLELNTQLATTNTIPSEQVFNPSLSYPTLYPGIQQEHRLETKEETEITLATQDEIEINHTTTPIVYTPEYNEITASQIQIENSLVTTESETILNTGQSLITDDLITLQQVTGDNTTTTTTTSTVQLNPVDQTEQTINGELTLEIESSIHSAEVWKDELTEVDTVSSVEQQNESLIVTLEDNEYTIVTTTVKIEA